MSDELPLTEAPGPAPPDIPGPSPPPAGTEATASQIAHWMELYGTQRRQLYRWLAIGRAHNFPCPLDQPVEMLRWWAPPRMKHRIPQKILDAARAAAGAAPPPAAAAPEPSSPPAAPAGDLFAAASLDFPAQVERMRGELARIQRQLDEARRGKVVNGEPYVDQAAVESLLRQELAVREPLRKAETDLTAWLQQRGQLAPTSAVRAENARICGAIFAAVRRLVKSIRPHLAGLPDAAADKLWEDEVRKCFSALKEAKFTVDLPPCEPDGV